METLMPQFVIVVDAQHDFMIADGALPVGGAEKLIAPMNEWLAALTPEDTAGILFTFDTHEPERYAGSPEAEQFPLHCVRGQPGWSLAVDPGRIDPAIPIYRMEKGVFAMWEEADLEMSDMRDPAAPAKPRDAFFDQLGAGGVEEVIVIGVAADFCVRWAVDGLVQRGFRVTVPAALTRGIVQQIDSVAAESWPPSVVQVA
jgi:nicotinamidase/pyrazinamidase